MSLANAASLQNARMQLAACHSRCESLQQQSSTVSLEI